MIKIGQYYFNINNITWIIEREVFFNNGKSIWLTEPELQDLFAILFDERTALEKMIDETKKDLSRDDEVKKAAKAMSDGIDKRVADELNKKDTNVKVDRNNTVSSRNSTNKPKRVSK